MSLFGGKRKELLKDGNEAKAVIRESRPFVKDFSGGAEPGESGILSHLDELGIGKRRYGRRPWPRRPATITSRSIARRSRRPRPGEG